MTLDQGFAFAIILGTIGLLIWDRIRYDLVALIALLAAIACGIVTPNDAFRGFSDDIVIIVGSALVVSAAIGRSGLVETLMKPLVPRMQTSVFQVAVLGSAVTALSAFIKNIGALAIFIPIALQVARRTEKPASRVLMPLAFGSLLGGLITLIGTSPNVIVSRMREQMTGEPFRMFDFAPVGIGLAVVGMIFLTFGWRLLPRIRRRAGATPETRFSIEDYITEVRLPAVSAYVGRTVRDLEALGDGDVTVAAIIREGYRRYIPTGHWTLFEEDILVLKADTHALSKLVETCFALEPDTACRGAEKAFVAYAGKITELWKDEGKRAEVTDDWFRAVVARTIIFRTAEKVVSEAGWYEGGYRAQVVAYICARLTKCAIDLSRGGRLDYRRIWGMQGCDAVVRHQLDAIGEVMMRVLRTPPREGQNISEWAKQQACRETALQSEVPIIRGLAAWVVDTDTARSESQETRATGEVDRDLQIMQEVLAIPPERWSAIAGACSSSETDSAL
jgi:hypothetical protein